MFEAYLDEINAKREKATEYTFRTPLENLLNEVKPSKSVEIIQENKKENKKEKNFGRPDFTVSKNGLEIGAIETKPLGADLGKVIQSEQIQRYLGVVDNLIVTDYRKFILFKHEEIIIEETLFNIRDSSLKSEKVKSVRVLLDEFFSQRFKKIKKAKTLSLLLAKNAKYLRDELRKIWETDIELSFKEKLYGLYNLFQETLIEELNDEEFLDAYTQTIAYGLFLSRLNAGKDIGKRDFIDYIPSSLGVFEEIFSLLRLKNIPDSISWIVDRIIEILNNVDYKSLNEELSFSSSPGDEDEDPYIYFYENFLKAYDKEKRVEKGVYYTPLPVVNFIVENTRSLLKINFKKTGLSDGGINILDFATGTGTFLLESYKKSLSEVDDDLKEKFVKENLLKSYYGFEYLIAPYTVSHLKLTQYLEEEGYKLDKNDRVQVYLTDTLDDTRHKGLGLFPNLSSEGKKANQIKLDEKIWVILGNPPYSNYSRNNKPFIKKLIEAYKKDLNEKKINLDDDYIKFLRFAQCKIEGVEYEYEKNGEPVIGELAGSGKGIIGVITNNSYLHTVTRRGMRKSLLKTFDKIYILNLHGYRSEPDENIFDIRDAGVAITLFVKTDKPLPEKEVYYYSSLENGYITRDEKRNLLNNNNINSIDWKRLNPEEPHYWFVDKDLSLKDEYDEFWGLDSIFKVFGTGVKTDRDDLFIDFDKSKLSQRLKTLLSGNLSEDFIEEHGVKDSRSYNLTKRIREVSFKNKSIKKINYRPFDRRWCYYEVGLTSRPNNKVFKHFINHENIGLVFKRQNKKTPFTYSFVTDILAESCLFESSYANNVVAPLYLYDVDDVDPSQGSLGFDSDKKELNFNEEFIEEIESIFSETPTPRDVFNYLYSILNSHTYRERYHEFLKFQYPKIPITDEQELFNDLAELGGELIECHLMNVNYDDENIEYFGSGDIIVEKFTYDQEANLLFLNEEQYLSNVNEEEWEFYLGGYQVLDKYLGYRKGRELSFNDMQHLKNIILTIRETIRIQERIDELAEEQIFSLDLSE